MNHSILEVGGDILSVSQFTLYANTSKGRRPSYIDAARPEQADELWNTFNELLEQEGLNVETGIFGAMMDVELVNDGPVTIIIDSKSKLVIRVYKLLKRLAFCGPFSMVNNMRLSFI